MDGRHLDEVLTEEANEYRLELAKRTWDWEPHSGGQREFFLAPQKRKILDCGRQYGKTFVCGADAGSFLISFGGTQILFAPTNDQTDLLFDQIVFMLLDSEYAPYVKFARRPTRDLYLMKDKKRMGVIRARSTQNEGRNIRGFGAHRVIIDEASRVEEDVVDQVISPMLSTTGGQLVMISTPYGRNHFYREWLKGQKGSSNYNPERYFSMKRTSYDNPYQDKTYLDEEKRKLPPFVFNQEYMAEFLESVDAVFPLEAWNEPGEKLSALLDEPLKTHPLEVNTDNIHHKFSMGCDPARKLDACAVSITDISVWPFKVVYSEEFPNENWQEMSEHVGQLALDWNVISLNMDCTGVGDPFHEMVSRYVYSTNANIAINPIVFTYQIKRDMVENLASKFHQGVIKIPRQSPVTEKMIQQLKNFQRDMRETSNYITYSAPKGEHDDLVTALMLSIWNQMPTFTNKTQVKGEAGLLHDRHLAYLSSVNEEKGEDLCLSY